MLKSLKLEAEPGGKTTDNHGYFGNDTHAVATLIVEQKRRAGLKEVIITSGDDCKETDEKARKRNT